MLRILSTIAGGLLLCACLAQAQGIRENPQDVKAKPKTLPVANAELYQQRCGICHLEAGQGVPGAFPPLDQRLAQWAQTNAGQGYLVSVVANGLYGVLQVNGQQYAGAMPGLAAQLTTAEIAGLLNFVLVEFAGAPALFTDAAVATYLDVIGAGPSLPLRPQ